MINFAKRIYEPIRKGNEYRLEQYGKPQTMAESCSTANKIRVEQKQKRHKGIMFPSGKQLQSIDLYKASFSYWDEWSGGRYVRRDNPFIEFSTLQWRSMFGDVHRPSIELNSVVRSCSYTGKWSEYIETNYA